MKKVGLVSVRNYNYGSILQAFAFQRLLLDEGIDNEIIFYEKKSGIKQFLRVFNIPLLKAKTKSIWRSVYCKFDKDVGNILRKRNAKFEEFVTENLILSQKYVGRAALQDGAKQYSAFALGSDQVWNPMNLGSDFYTLTFCPREALKVTYASSFGVARIPKYQEKRTRAYLEGINEIAVRETSGAEIIKQLTGREVSVVVDPTLLLDAQGWMKYIPDERIVREPYIFAYFVGASPEHRQAVIALAQKTGRKVVGIPFVDELVESDKYLMDASFADIGPAEFVNLIRHADYVCTDSFHATVFSIQYQRKFFVFDRYKADDKASMNSRLSSILSKLRLEQRLVTRRGDVLQWYNEQIDYETALKALSEFRMDSLAYLKKIVAMLRTTLNKEAER